MFCSMMLLFLFWQLVVRQIDQVIYHLKFRLNLFLMLIFALCCSWRLTNAMLRLFGRSQMYLMCNLCFWLRVGSICLYVLKYQFYLGSLYLAKGCGVLQPWWLGFPRCPSCKQVTGPGVLPQPYIIFLLCITTMDWHQDSIQWAVLGFCE